MNTTVARWPNFRPNNTKQAGKKYFWPEKIGGRTATNFSEKWLKTGRKKLSRAPLLELVCRFPRDLIPALRVENN
jgi:hypothetical protein